MIEWAIDTTFLILLKLCKLKLIEPKLFKFYNVIYRIFELAIGKREGIHDVRGHRLLYAFSPLIKSSFLAQDNGLLGWSNYVLDLSPHINIKHINKKNNQYMLFYIFAAVALKLFFCLLKQWSKACPENLMYKNE